MNLPGARDTFRRRVREWAAEDDARRDRIEEWERERADYFERVVPTDPTLADGTKDHDGLIWETYIDLDTLDAAARAAMAGEPATPVTRREAWTPFGLTEAARPKGPLPLFPLDTPGRNPLTMTERYAALALIHDAICAGAEPINPWHGLDFAELDATEKERAAAFALLVRQCQPNLAADSFAWLAPHETDKEAVQAILASVKRDLDPRTIADELRAIASGFSDLAKDDPTLCVSEQRMGNHPAYIVVSEGGVAQSGSRFRYLAEEAAIAALGEASEQNGMILLGRWLSRLFEADGGATASEVILVESKTPNGKTVLKPTPKAPPTRSIDNAAAQSARLLRRMIESLGARHDDKGDARPPALPAGVDTIDEHDAALLAFLNRTPTLRRKVSDVLPDKGPQDRKAVATRLRKLADRTPPLVDYPKGGRSGVAILPAGAEALKRATAPTPR